ncbi:SBBP repeat-containing protein [Mucilaginibacter gilvus]|uniref:SMP-30/Gluconolactonase/LRE-like region domain-containing protein n=1 Tax=Mucilaginibacter gilvus TaxID=2305909 RepID=A0A3S3VNQ7_9SPHI|nr:hypothetical protein EPL05_02765 [Mucilaginibacter gilvus]
MPIPGQLGDCNRFYLPQIIKATIPGKAALFNNPTGIAADTSGNVYVVDLAIILSAR